VPPTKRTGSLIRTFLQSKIIEIGKRSHNRKITHINITIYSVVVGHRSQVTSGCHAVFVTGTQPPTFRNKVWPHIQGHAVYSRAIYQSIRRKDLKDLRVQPRRSENFRTLSTPGTPGVQIIKTSVRILLNRLLYVCSFCSISGMSVLCRLKC
jgi:hypothetical protein